MLIKIENLGMAYSESTPEEAARRVAKEFGVVVELTGRTSVGSGWPEANVIGTPAALLRMFTEDGGWATGDADDDAETVYYYFKDAREVFGK